MKVFVYPGQGAQFTSMGKSMYDQHARAKELFEEANEILGFRITDIMFSGSDDELKQTNVTQPAIFLHSVILSKIWGKLFTPEMVAGHSLGEFSALTVSDALSFEDGLKLVSKRAHAMQKACEMQPSIMAVIIGLPDEVVENVCKAITDEIVVCANYNCPGQIAISGTEAGIDKACEMLTEAGAKRALKLKVGGAFHSPLMEPARAELAEAIESTAINEPVCPIYQNYTALPSTDPEVIKENLIAQLTGSVKWTQTVRNMVAGGADHFVELGPGKTLQGLILKIDNSVTAESYQDKVTKD
ncbi:MAG: ACP S-malonyltransferase [Tannerella sp.]|jgi:[acyl-carrier-protein] S-malonyltransferase|nr:ACP S-malonyltransferase [Tannerella sp.]